MIKALGHALLLIWMLFLTTYPRTSSAIQRDCEITAIPATVANYDNVSLNACEGNKSTPTTGSSVAQNCSFNLYFVKEPKKTFPISCDEVGLAYNDSISLKLNLDEEVNNSCSFLDNYSCQSTNTSKSFSFNLEFSNRTICIKLRKSCSSNAITSTETTESGSSPEQTSTTISFDTSVRSDTSLETSTISSTPVTRSNDTGTEKLITSVNRTESTEKNNQDGDWRTIVIIVPVVVVVLIILSSVLILYCHRSRNTRPRETQTFQQTQIPRSDNALNEMTQSGGAAIANGRLSDQPDVVPGLPFQSSDIPLEMFESYFEECKRKLMISEKFKKIPTYFPGSTEVARKSENVIKNRYKNIIPYDGSRVKLETLNQEPDSDYINASFICGYGNKSGKYIAAQGPKPETENDFWRMVVSYKVMHIIMLTVCQENLKKLCEEYWPRDLDSRKLYDKVVVKTKTIEETANYIIRTFSVSHKGVTTLVRHYQMTTWKDKTKLDSPVPMLDLLQRVRAGSGKEEVPMVVHCSAGVGRTGTYIALDMLLDQAAAENKVNVDGTIHRLRTQRAMMVQTAKQYEFIHEALVMYFRIGGSVINTSYIIYSSRELGQYTMEQFSKIQQYTKRHPPDLSDCQGSEPENIMKNRNQHVMPGDRVRPYLTLPVQGTNDYINGVFVQSFWKVDDLIVTQIPLQNTVIDFWRLVHDHNVSVLMLLEDRDIPQFWPTEGEPIQTFGPLTVQMTDINIHSTCSNIVIRDFTINKPRRPQDSLHMRMYQMRGWPSGQSVPINTTDMLQMCDLLENQLRHGSGKTVIQCLDGVTHSGLLATGSHVIGQSHLWSDIDFPLSVLALRERRPQFIVNVDQYRYLYYLLQTHLTRSEVQQLDLVYANVGHGAEEPMYANYVSETSC